jgi:hypothetical protein
MVLINFFFSARLDQWLLLTPGTPKRPSGRELAFVELAHRENVFKDLALENELQRDDLPRRVVRDVGDVLPLIVVDGLPHLLLPSTTPGVLPIGEQVRAQLIGHEDASRRHALSEERGHKSSFSLTKSSACLQVSEAVRDCDVTRRYDSNALLTRKRRHHESLGSQSTPTPDADFVNSLNSRAACALTVATPKPLISGGGTEKRNTNEQGKARGEAGAVS